MPTTPRRRPDRAALIASCLAGLTPRSLGQPLADPTTSPLPAAPITPGHPTGVAYDFLTATAADADQHARLYTDTSLRHKANAAHDTLSAANHHAAPEHASRWASLRDRYAESAAAGFTPRDDARAFLAAYTRARAAERLSRGPLIGCGIDFAQPVGVQLAQHGDRATVCFLQGLSASPIDEVSTEPSPRATSPPTRQP